MATQMRRTSAEMIAEKPQTREAPWSTPKSFKDFYEREVGLVHFILKSYRMVTEDRDELVQETFLRLYAARDRVDPSKARAFLVVTARNLALDAIRRRNCRRTDLAGEDIGTFERRMWDSDDEHDQRLAAVSRAVAKIGATPGGEVFRMFYGEGLSIKEICEQTSEALGTITARLWRARQRYKGRICAEIDACAT